jgi:uncharacterized protein (UPF0332 family)
LYRGDPVIMNILRYGDVLIDFGGFFNPLKILLEKGKIRPSPESIYVCLNRVPIHINNSKQAEMSAIEGIFWAFVDSAHSLLMAIQVLPPSPEHIALLLRDNFVEKKLLNMKYVTWMRDIYNLHRRINHREIKDLEGKIIDEWQNRAEEFLNVTLKLIKEII